jgi:hypothetical protein
LATLTADHVAVAIVPMSSIIRDQSRALIDHHHLRIQRNEFPLQLYPGSNHRLLTCIWALTLKVEQDVLVEL